LRLKVYLPTLQEERKPMLHEKGQSFPELLKPPIAEVVCGVVFDSFDDLDALLLGVYWNSRAGEFPKRSLQPALVDEVGFAIGAFPMRAFLATLDDQFVLQLQHDRFFMNWRSTGSAYPRFSEQHGSGGLLVRALREFQNFATFLESRCEKSPSVQRVELTKIDILRRGEHWSDLDDLVRLVPVTGVFREIQRSESREVNLRFVERGPEGVAIVHVATLMDADVPNALRIEARCIATATSDLSTAFTKANTVLNEAFFKLIPEAHARFGVKGLA
jgi:uncharacterized protein (TIGR04255 family)